MSCVYLFIAIAFEVAGTTALTASNGMTRLTPTLITICAYCASFYFLGQALLGLPMAVVYSMWSGIGIAAVAFIGWMWFSQPLSPATIAGLATTAAGVGILGSVARH